jgi:hypothetical protein
MSLHSSLEGIDRVSVGCSELADLLFVGVKINGLGNLLAKFYLTGFGHFDLVVADTMLVALAP